MSEASRPLLAHRSALRRVDWSAPAVYAIPVAVVGVMAWMLGEIAWLGADKLSWTFLTEAPRNAGREGGIGPIIASTGLIVGICLATALPLAVATSVLIAEYLPAHSRTVRVMRTLLDVLAAVPSIVFGVFGYAFFSLALDFGFSILSGGLTLATMILPILIGSIEQSLRAVPLDMRIAGAGLGMTRPAVIARVLLPLASPGILAGTLLGLGRALAETAALVFTSGYVARMPESLLDSGRTLSIHVFDLSMNVPGGSGPAAGTTLLLVLLLLVLNGALLWLIAIWRRRTGMTFTLTP